MTTDIIEINNFIVLIEQSYANKITTENCGLDDEIIGISFYGSGDVALNINYKNQQKTIQNTSGIATSFFGNDKVSFTHKIAPNKALQSISIFSTIKNLHKLPQHEFEIYNQYLQPLLYPKSDFVEGPQIFMNLDMQKAVEKICNTTYTGATRKLFIKSQVMELLSHFFAIISNKNWKENTIPKKEIEKLYQAKKILSNNMVSPPSLNELSKQIGLNNYKLKKNFKELFGIPVFKYLQNERLEKAHELLCNGNTNIQETAWFVGYESLSSFSNAFTKKFGFRPSQIKK